MLLKYIRRIIFAFSFVLAIGLYAYAQTEYGSQDLKQIRLVQFYAFSSFTFLYFSLLASPLFAAFPQLPGRALYIKARKALGVSAFFFGVLHGYVAFFGSLGGFAGLGFLSERYLSAIVLSASALFILSLLAVTSLQRMIVWLGNKWKPLHRLVYVAGVLIVMHAVQLGTHFVDLSEAIPQLFFAALAVLFLLEIIRVEKYVLQKWKSVPKYSAAFFLFSLFVGSYVVYWGPYVSGDESFSLHGEHERMLMDETSSPMPGHSMGGVVTPGKYVLSEIDASPVTAGNVVQKQFSILDTENNRQPVKLFQTLFEKQLHAIIVDSTLEYFNHVHPVMENGVFTLTETFPKDGKYYVYLDYQPFGAAEQQSVFNVYVGQQKAFYPLSSRVVDANMTKVFGNYEVSLATDGEILMHKVVAGEQLFRFTIRDAETKSEIMDIQPYLGSFGHLVMVNQKTYEYVHVHPADIAALSADAKGGPEIAFKPMAFGKQISSGNYRIFSQFKHNDKIFVADFTVEVKE